MQGPVEQPFSYDEAHPYAAGQHRGVDIGADAAGETVVAPAAGTVSFAGSVPTSGKSVTIETADGYSVTLTHLGSITVAKGATVAEQDAIGTVGPSGTPELDGPYVHMGVRLTADPNGYIDPLGLLPDPVSEGAAQNPSPAPKPASSRAPEAAPKRKPAPVASRSRRVKVTVREQVRVHQRRRAQEPRSDTRTTRSRHRPVVRTRHAGGREQATFLRRPVVEPIGLDAGHTIRPAVPLRQPRREPSGSLFGLGCNGAAALVALGAAVAAGRRRRRLIRNPSATAQVLHLPPAAVVHRRFSRAA